MNTPPNAGSWASLCWHNSGRYAWLELVGHKARYAPGGGDGARTALIGAVPEGAGKFQTGRWAAITGQQVRSFGRDASRIHFGSIANDQFYLGVLSNWEWFKPEEAKRYAGGANFGAGVSSLNFALGALKAGFAQQFQPKRLPLVHTGIQHSNISVNTLRNYLASQVNNLYPGIRSPLFSNVAQPYVLWGSGIQPPGPAPRPGAGPGPDDGGFVPGAAQHQAG